MFKNLDLPELPEERLELWNSEHIKVIKKRELISKLKKSKPYIKWRREYEFTEFVMNNIHWYKVWHLYEKYSDRYKEFEWLIEQKEIDFCCSLEINYLDIKEQNEK